MKSSDRMKFKLATWSIRQALKQQGLWHRFRRLEEICPDIGDQYTHATVDTEYKKVNVRGMHAFQVDVALRALDLWTERKGGKGDKLKVVDLGDSSGNHLLYLKSLRPEVPLDELSINVDPMAVRKIRAKGLKALVSTAEEFAYCTQSMGMGVDVVMMFEVLEHLECPIAFLKGLSLNRGGLLVVTVPFVRESGVGLWRSEVWKEEEGSAKVAEGAHIFELSPQDWQLVFAYAGWKCVYERVYYQYPRWTLRWLAGWLWKRKDYEGFYGCILEKGKSGK